MRFSVLTKTLWNEPPRIRHQVAEMLLRHRHEVLFVERNAWLGRLRRRYEGNLALARHGELVHHQLRVHPLLSRLNAAMESAALRRLGIGSDAGVILNFNYDHYFLRDLAADTTIISIINDDFVAGARWFSRREIMRVLGTTIDRSDHTLVVSYPLLVQAKQFTDNVSLFLPWARQPYRRPAPGRVRTEALYWGYINDRLDASLIRELLERGLVVNFIGPVGASRQVAAVLEHRNARYHGVGQLDSFAEVLNRCACSILAYDARDPMVAAITINNRAFALLSRGLPLLYSPLPALLAAPSSVIRVCRGADGFWDGVRQSSAEFDHAQSTIEAFLEDHNEERRYEQLMAVIEGARTGGPWFAKRRLRAERKA